MVTFARVALVVFVAIVVQLSFVAPITVLGARGDVVLLVAIAAGIEAGPERGAVVGFAAGLTFDLLQAGPAGLSALAYTLVGYAAGTFGSAVLRSSWWIPLAATVLASALGVVVMALLEAVFGGAPVTVGHLPAIVLVVAAINALLSRPTRWAVRRALAPPWRDRPSLR
ncbi:MAG: rod shape-determining protein MreD [Actinobacteria bacterium]|nr:rod shape-determining protein MreD [Actinomycetota bacterium]